MNFIPEKYELYFQLFKTILKYWNSDLLSNPDELMEENIENLNPTPQELVEDLKSMGPAFIKLGQLLSTRPDMLPEPYLLALSRLQDDVGDVCSFEEVNAIIEEDFGQATHGLFAEFDPDPLANASIGQVHEAVLRSGEKVAVKIRKPGIKKRFIEDIEVLMKITAMSEKYNETSRKFAVHSVVEELKYMLFQELDYENEKQNLLTLKKNMSEFSSLVVPEVYSKYCSSRVLTMEFVDGQKITALSESEKGSVAAEEMVKDFIKGYLKQIIIDGFVHADPHPGNILITSNNKLAILDLGMVTQYSEDIKAFILKLIIALGGNNGDSLARILLDKCEYDSETTDLEKFRRKVVRLVAENKNSKADDLKTGLSILEINKIAAQENIILPMELVSLGKVLLNMDQIIAFLAPDYRLQKTIREYVEKLIRRQTVEEVKSGNVMQTLLESKELITNLPHRLNKISDNLAQNKFKIEIDAFEESQFIKAFQKVANRITVGLIVAALILGAALIMRIPTSWKLYGYPGFAVLLFVLAAVIALYLVYQILFKDED